MNIHWTPGIGDPTLVGWITVIAYIGTAFICAIAAKAPNLCSPEIVSDRPFWLGVAAIFLFLAINKQLDLQSLLTEVGRAAAKAQGWYGKHRFYQVAFVAIAGLAGALIMLSAIWHFRFRGGSLKLALCGLGFTCTFVVLRAASIHHVDGWLGSEVVGLQWNWLLELSGITTVTVGASWSCLNRSRYMV